MRISERLQLSSNSPTPKNRTGWRRQAIPAAAMWGSLAGGHGPRPAFQALTKSDRIVFEPPEGFDEAANGAKPFIVCGLHLGNWEILAHGGQRLGISLIGVYQRMSNPHVETLMRRLREPLYKAGLTPKTPMAARVLLRAIKDGASPCFLADLRDDNGPSVPPFQDVQSRDQLSFPHSPSRLAPSGNPALYRSRIPASWLALQHSHRATISMPQTNNSAADNHRCDASPAAPIRSFHPRSARTMDVGARKVGLIALARIAARQAPSGTCD